jgi:ankyrin repeat protein
MVYTIDDALTQLGRTDPTFNDEVRKILAPVRDRFFSAPSHDGSKPQDGLHTPPPYLSDPELRKIAVALAEFALQRGIDINLPWESDGTTLLHEFVLLRDFEIAVECVEWFLAHGADPNRQRDDGETPLSLAAKFGRTEVAELMRAHGKISN